MFHIDYDGQWYHDGDVIQRKTLKKLLGEKSLTIDNQGHYWMSGPFEKYPVTVEDVPYVVIDYRIRNEGQADQMVWLLTDMGERIALGPEKKLFLRPEVRGGLSVPYVEVRYGLMARLSRQIRQRLKTTAKTLMAGDVPGDGVLTIRSEGQDHPLGVEEAESDHEISHDDAVAAY